MAEDRSLSAKELQFLEDTDFLLTKVIIQEKIQQLMANTEENLRGIFENESFAFPEGTFARSGKISKGENYKHLPYFMLDYPRKFSHQGIFAFRTMMWWGNFFSNTLHLQGKEADIFRPSLVENADLLYNQGIYIGVNKTPWEYHYHASNYFPVDDFVSHELKKHIEQHPFIKLSRKMPIERWSALPDFTLSSFRLFSKFLNLSNTG